MGPITDLIGGRVTCIGLGNAYTQPIGYIIVKVQVGGVWGYNEDQIVLDLLNFTERIPVLLGTPSISHIINVMKERARCLGQMPGWPISCQCEGQQPQW